MAMAMFLSQVAYAQFVPPPPLPPPTSDPISVTLIPSSTTVLQGDDFFIDVYTEGVTIPDAVLSFGFDITSIEGIDFIESIVGPHFNDTSDLLGDTDVSGHQTPPATPGDVLLATLNFKATGNAELGDYLLGINSSTFDPNEGLMVLSLDFIPFPPFVNVSNETHDIDSSVQLTIASAAIPEPSSLLMTMLGFAGLGFVAVRMRKENSRKV